jgi:hypothetical protein
MNPEFGRLMVLMTCRAKPSLKRPEIMTVSVAAVRVEWFNEIYQATRISQKVRH